MHYFSSLKSMNFLPCGSKEPRHVLQFHKYFVYEYSNKSFSVHKTLRALVILGTSWTVFLWLSWEFEIHWVTEARGRSTQAKGRAQKVVFSYVITVGQTCWSDLKGWHTSGRCERMKETLWHNLRNFFDTVTRYYSTREGGEVLWWLQGV